MCLQGEGRRREGLSTVAGPVPRRRGEVSDGGHEGSSLSHPVSDTPHISSVTVTMSSALSF